jgi:phosphate starvation-inducible protein PhoH
LPGTKIFFHENTFIKLEKGSINLLGEKKDPIVLLAKNKFWKGILISSNNAGGITTSTTIRKQYDKIIITRPTVSKEEIGFLPGDLREKMDPWVQPIYQNFFALYDKVKIEKFIEDGKIEIVPVSFMRGRTFLDSLIIVDEAQNVTHEQMEMITSRIGLRSKMVVCGDSHQTDLKKKSDSGFKFLYSAARKIKNLEAITLTTNHRNEIVEDLINYYNEAVDKGASITTSGSYNYNSKN